MCLKGMWKELKIAVKMKNFNWAHNMISQLSICQTILSNLPYLLTVILSSLLHWTEHLFCFFVAAHIFDVSKCVDSSDTQEDDISAGIKKQDF